MPIRPNVRIIMNDNNTQTRPMAGMSGSWLTYIPALWSRRAPGNTCMQALHAITVPDAALVRNNSKGCGGVMRVAPVGIYSAAHQDMLDLEHAAFLAGYAADWITDLLTSLTDCRNHLTVGIPLSFQSMMPPSRLITL